ncbi:MAG: hypothetical protein VX017_10280 [Pseudomonadota bacterium]|nr:hypothetical protein [Pseudomonadota bacterium]
MIFPKKTRAEISRRMVRFSCRDLSYETDSGPKTKTVSDPNFQLTAAAAASQQLSHLARALDHHAQGPNIPFGVNPSLRYIPPQQKLYLVYMHIPLQNIMFEHRHAVGCGVSLGAPGAAFGGGVYLSSAYDMLIEIKKMGNL